MGEDLRGGRVTLVQRDGDTVIRAQSRNSDVVHRLLRLLEERGWDGAPRLLGVQGDDEVLSFVDWDLAGPGSRVQDLAHVCWQWLDLGPRVTDIDAAARKIAVICDAYGLRDRAEVLPAIVEWQERCWRGIEAGAAQEDPAMRRLVADGISDGVRAAEHWTRAHQDELAAGMSSG